MFGYMADVWLHSWCLATWLMFGYMADVWLHSWCLATWLMFGYMADVWLHSWCLATWLMFGYIATSLPFGHMADVWLHSWCLATWLRFSHIAISLIFRLIILQRARCDNNILILSILQLFIRSTVAIYSILPIGQFFVVAQKIFPTSVSRQCF